MNSASDARVKLRSLLLTALIRVPSTASNSRPNRSSSPAQQHELAEHRAEGVAVVAAEIGDGLEVGLQMPQQPDHLDVAVGLGFQPAARAHPVQIAVDVELQQIGGRIARTACRLRLDADEPGRREVQPIDEGVDEPHRVVGADVIVHRFRQQQRLRSVVTGDVRHSRILPRPASAPESVPPSFHTVCKIYARVAGLNDSKDLRCAKDTCEIEARLRACSPSSQAPHRDHGGRSQSEFGLHFP